ncbi:MAG: TIGR03435 family protein [Acidobacteria bacterium]|nr:TIGR03435 family protein [Acidobacteriota bacterium]
MSGLFTAFLIALVAAAQTGEPSGPSFEVVSIRQVPPNAPSILRSQDFTPVLPGGQYVDSRVSLFFMIAYAYGVTNPSQQLVGLPGWAKERSYSVAAKAGPDYSADTPAANDKQVRLMMRKMLADRFQLRLHTEIRRERILNLQVAKGGFRIPAVDPPVPPAKEGLVSAAVGDSGGRMIGKKSTTAGMPGLSSSFCNVL